MLDGAADRLAVVRHLEETSDLPLPAPTSDRRQRHDDTKTPRK